MKGRVDPLEQIRQQSIQARSQALIKEQRERYMSVKLAPGAASGSGGGRQKAGYVVFGYVDEGYFGFN
jgi:hypothetical protein